MRGFPNLTMTTIDLAPELPPVPRAVRLRPGLRALRIVLLLLLVGAPSAFLAVNSRLVGELQHIVDEGVVVQGRIEGLRTSKGRRGSTSYYANYGFDVDGRHFTGSAKLPEHQWQSLSNGQRVTISYWPKDPGVSQLGTVDQAQVESASAKGWLVAGILLLVPAGLLFFLARAWRRSLALLRDGRAVTGKVVAYEGFRSAKKRDKLSYRFRPPGSTDVDAVARLGKKLKPAPEPGTAIVVLQSQMEPTVFATLPQLLEHVVLERIAD